MGEVFLQFRLFAEPVFGALLQEQSTETGPCEFAAQGGQRRCGLGRVKRWRQRAGSKRLRFSEETSGLFPHRPEFFLRQGLEFFQHMFSGCCHARNILTVAAAAKRFS